MLIGLTFDLRSAYLAMGYSEEETAEFDREATIEAIASTLHRLGHRTDRIGHIFALTRRLAAGDRWDLVFNIAEGLHGYAREAQVPALLDAYEIPYTFSDPMVLAVALHKGMTKHVVRDLGIPTPNFAVAADERDVAAVRLPFPLFVKPVAEGTGRGITGKSKATNRRQLLRACREVWRACRQPAIIEEFLPGREFTVGITGTGRQAVAVGVLEVVLKPRAEADAYSYVNKEKCEELVTYALAKDRLARAAAEVALASWRGLECRDGGRVDLRVGADGVPQFLEVNPLAGLHPEHSDLPIVAGMAGIPYKELIKRILSSARERVPRRRPKVRIPKRS